MARKVYRNFPRQYHFLISIHYALVNHGDLKFSGILIKTILILWRILENCMNRFMLFVSYTILGKLDKSKDNIKYASN